MSEANAAAAGAADSDGAAGPGFGVILPTSDPLDRGDLDLVEVATEIEAAGFDSLWVGDHLSFHAPILEANVAMAAAAAVTSRIRLGFGVYLLALRPLAWSAKQLTSLQALSGNRLILGVGVGGESPDEWAAAGVPRSERGKRTDLYLPELKRLLAGEAADDPVGGAQIPALAPRGEVPPIWIGGRADAALRRAARFGQGWLGIWIDPKRVVQAREKLAAFAEEAGRRTPRIGLTVFFNIDDDESRARDEISVFLESQYQLEFSAVERWALHGGAERVGERLAELIAAGVEDFVFIPASRRPRPQFERLAGVREAVCTYGKDER